MNVTVQFPTTCVGSRFLRVTDDLNRAGMGFTAKMLCFLLCFANRKGRIFIESERGTGRWCSRSPYSLQCYYEPWTNCSTKHALDVENISLSRFYRDRRWYGASIRFKKQLPSARAILFRPRPSVSDYVNAVRNECIGPYWTLHIRSSPEKIKEQRNQILPPVAAYFDKLPSTVPRVLIQTANPLCYTEALALCANRMLHCCATNFSRHVRDVWGGWNKSLVDESGLTAAVNGELGRHGEGLVSLETSIWTWFISVGTTQRVIPLFPTAKTALRDIADSCDLKRRDRCIEN